MCLCLDLLVGMPAVTAGDLSKKLSDEHAKHLVAELGVKVSSNLLHYIL